jgi:hypothetical protein
MCSPATCRACGKPSYTGCGQHVERVLGHVPAHQRCRCTAQQKQAALPPSLYATLFRR